MEFARDMLNLRREIDSLRAARSTMINGLHQFNREFSQSVMRKMSDMRQMFAEECGRSLMARRAFNQHNRRMVSHMIGAFNMERRAAHRHFMGKNA